MRGIWTIKLTLSGVKSAPERIALSKRQIYDPRRIALLKIPLISNRFPDIKFRKKDLFHQWRKWFVNGDPFYHYHNHHYYYYYTFIPTPIYQQIVFLHGSRSIFDKMLSLESFCVRSLLRRRCLWPDAIKLYLTMIFPSVKRKSARTHRLFRLLQ